MESPKISLWSKIKPWLVILSAIPAWMLIFVFLQTLLGLIYEEIWGKDVISQTAQSGNFNPIWDMITYANQFVTMFFVVWIYWVKFFNYKFPKIGFERTTTFVKELLLGFLTGVILLGVIFLILLLTNQMEITSLQFSIKYFLFHVFIYAIVAYNEELLFRGYLLGATMKLANKYLVLIVFAFVFSFAHAFNANFQIIPAVNIFLAGIILGIYYIHTKRLWYSISLHFTWNFLQGPVFGSNVSGGKDEHTIITQNITGKDWITGGEFGFEGSVLMTVILIVLILTFELYFRKKAVV